MRENMKCVWGCVCLLAAVIASATEVVVKERFSSDNGSYRQGKFGDALWVYMEGNRLDYPVNFKNSEFAEGTMAFWIKTTRQRWTGYDCDDVLILSDNVNSIFFQIYGGSATSAIPPRYFNVGIRGVGTGGAAVNHARFQMGGDFHQNFHQITYTWGKDSSAAYLDGALIGKMDSTKSKFLKALDTSKLHLTIGGHSGFWIDETMILGQMLTEAEARELWTRRQAWRVDGKTALYLDFDKTLNGESFIASNGNLLKLMSHVGHPAAIFVSDDRKAFDFKLINNTSKSQNVYLSGEVRGIDKKRILERIIPCNILAGNYSEIRFDLGIKAKGLLWGYFKVKDESGKVLGEDDIPFALTLGIDAKRANYEDFPGGLVMSGGLNPPVYEKWADFRVISFWRDAEYAPGKWDFEALDMVVEDAVRTGRRPILMLAGSPDWQVKRFPVEKYENHDKRSYACPENIEDFRNYVKRLGERYKGKVFDYEVWNEPYWNDPAGGYFGGTTEEYIQIVKASAETLSQIDKDIRVWCGLGGSALWQDAVIRETSKYTQHYGVHPYNLASSYEDDDKFANGFQELFRKYNVKAKLANTEISDFNLMQFAIDNDGYPMTGQQFNAAGRWEKFPSGLKANGRDYFHDPYTSSAFVARSLISSLAAGCEYFLWWSYGPGAIGSLSSCCNVPSIQEVAYANCLGLLYGYKYIKKINVSGESSKAYLFNNNGGGMIVAWSAQNEDFAYLELAGDRIEILDLYGNAYPFERYGDILKIRLSMFPVYIKGFSNDPLEGKPFMEAEFQERNYYPGKHCAVNVSISNPLDKPLIGKLTLKLPEGFDPIPPTEINFNPKQTVARELMFAIPSDISCGNHNVEMVFSSETRGFEKIILNKALRILSNAFVNEVSNKIRIDGLLGEWGDFKKFQIKLRNPQQVTIGTPYTAQLHDAKLKADWNGARDLSAYAEVKHDKEYLYFAVRVVDDVVTVNSHVKQPFLSYEGDCLELFIDARAPEKQDGKTFDNDVYQILLTAPTIKTAPLVTVTQPANAVIGGMVVNFMSHDDGYSMEAKIPITCFPKIMTQKTIVFGFDIAVDDKDDVNETGRKSQIMWSPSKSTSSDASMFGKLIIK